MNYGKSCFLIILMFCHYFNICRICRNVSFFFLDSDHLCFILLIGLAGILSILLNFSKKYLCHFFPIIFDCVLFHCFLFISSEYFEFNFFIKKIIYLESGDGKGQRGKENLKHALSGLDLMTLRPCPEPKPGVEHLSDCATQVSLISLLAILSWSLIIFFPF